MIVILFVLLFCGSVHAIDPQCVDNNAIAKYTWQGGAVWSDEQRDDIIAKSVTQFALFSTGTIATINDFAPVLVSLDDIALVTSTFRAQIGSNSFDHRAIIPLLNDKKYIKQMAIEDTKRIRDLQDSGLVDQETLDEIAELKSRRVFLKRRFQSLP